MNKFITLFLCCLLISSASFAQTADEKQITDRMETLRKTLITPDKAVLEDLVADELSYGHSTGVIEDKSAFVDALVNGKTVFTVKVSTPVFSTDEVNREAALGVLRGSLGSDFTVSKMQPLYDTTGALVAYSIWIER